MNLPNKDTYALLGRLAVLLPEVERAKRARGAWEKLTKEKREVLLSVIASRGLLNRNIEAARLDYLLSVNNPDWGKVWLFRNAFTHGSIMVFPAGDIVIYHVDEKKKERKYCFTLAELKCQVAGIEEFLKMGYVEPQNAAAIIKLIADWAKRETTRCHT